MARARDIAGWAGGDGPAVVRCAAAAICVGGPSGCVDINVSEVLHAASQRVAAMLGEVGREDVAVGGPRRLS